MDDAEKIKIAYKLYDGLQDASIEFVEKLKDLSIIAADEGLDDGMVMGINLWAVDKLAKSFKENVPAELVGAIESFNKLWDARQQAKQYNQE